MGLTLQVPINDIFIGDFWGFILSLLIAPAMAFWISAVRNKMIVVLGALIGAVIGFIIILAWVGTLVYDTVLPGANGGSTFFGAIFLCSILGISGGIIMDLLVARAHKTDYRRPNPHRMAHE
jgi:hypothetical protein